MVERSVGPYRILRRLGAGGMGEIFLAKDTRLKRLVALKSLTEGWVVRPDAQRQLLHEARAAAALNHPNIAAIYDVLQTEDGAFIVMEYVPGETLAERLRAGPLPPAAAAWIGVQLCDALAEAHAHGIIHRDLKPGNLAITPDGRFKVLDFGMAKTLRLEQSDPNETPSSGGIDLSQAGRRLVGTPPYLPPEHIRGDPVDERSDIYSAGVVLYELLTGRRPFEGPNLTALADAILNDSAPKPRDLEPAVSERLEHVVLKAMARDPGERYTTAAAMKADLLRVRGDVSDDTTSSEVRAIGSRTGRGEHPWWRTTRAWAIVGGLAALLAGVAAIGLRYRGDGVPGRPERTASPSIAVLPFTDFSREGDQEYFCDGIAEQIISRLARIEGLRVTARTSAFAFKGRNQDVRQVGQQLNVGKLLEGSVRKAGDRLRITVQVVNTADGFHSWSRSYDRDLIDVLTVQDEIAEEVAKELNLEVAEKAGLLASKHHTVDPEAYNLYLRGRYFWNKRTPQSLKNALQLFEQAVQKDPGYALAYVGIADTHTLLQVYEGAAPVQSAATTKAAIARALELDDTLAEAHASYAALKEREWDWEGAEKEYRCALELKPGDATVRCWFSQLLAELGRSPEAIAEIRRASLLDPLSPYANSVYGTVLYLARRYDDSKRQLDVALDLDPLNHLAHETLAYLYVIEGMRERAVAAARRSAEVAGNADTSVVLAYTCAASGKRDEALRILNKLEHLWGNGRGSPGRIAVVYAGLGNRDRALDWLEKARQEHDIWITQLKVDPVFDGLRSEDRYQKLLKQVGLER